MNRRPERIGDLLPGVLADLAALHTRTNGEPHSMTNRRNARPSREEWQADAERFARQQCYPSQRVSDQVADWVDGDEREQFADAARDARLGAGRVARLLEKDGTRLADIRLELTRVRRLVNLWEGVAERAAAAAIEAVVHAVAAEIERRKTDEAWAAELRRRAQIDADWVLPAQTAQDGAA